MVQRVINPRPFRLVLNPFVRPFFPDVKQKKGEDMDPELDVVALADRVAQRAGSRLNGGPAGPDPEGDGTAMGTGTGTGGRR